MIAPLILGYPVWPGVHSAGVAFLVAAASIGRYMIALGAVGLWFGKARGGLNALAGDVARASRHHVMYVKP
ncbi:hypothetical protein YTPLAS18_15350 [Nitrospira sp.]|nr:hypothetical protein YTPLAS18_15350 [Nitrospira sp.]